MTMWREDKAVKAALAKALHDIGYPGGQNPEVIHDLCTAVAAAQRERMARWVESQSGRYMRYPQTRPHIAQPDVVLLHADQGAVIAANIRAATP